MGFTCACDVSNEPCRFCFLVLLYAANSDTAAAQAGDFGFRFEVTRCLLDAERLDTFVGEFTKNLGGSPARIVTAKISLTDAQMTTIYRTIESIRFFDYPSTFVGVPAGLQEVITTTPSNTYRLEVRNAGVVHSVSWNDGQKPMTVEADRLRDLFSMVLGFIHDHPEFKRLPPRTIGCE
jgi:hypothetical protein